ncbi:hypothetical protein KR51_00002500 [Rubidibacter lacunae KORDI 51-2]|uniref:Tetratricopeptide repeat protein n=1 Tax=Rubidibacter lacunae KORDI 51-2 TaxID=582515 RepID=U5DTE0_9CHRO|nr:hypothetical protein [Rubidibacter lacunae]ERN42945.1 hypothetical protein KR51_00002500 [Rubidibacter lacunae KORDI 51-2]
MSRRIAAIAIALCCLGVVGLQFLRLKASNSDAAFYTQRLESREAATSLRLNLLSQTSNLGLRNLVADWVYLQFLQYFGSSGERQQMGFELADDYFLATIANDPRFISAYISLGIVNSLYAGQPDKSVAIYQQGLKHLQPELPLSDLVWRFKAIDELLLLGDTDAAQRSFEQASAWASQQDNPMSERRSKRAAQLARFLASNPDSRWVQASSWRIVLQNTTDLNVQRYAADRIRQLGGSVEVAPDGSLTVTMPPEE